MSDEKFSDFPPGGAMVPGDEIAGLRGGANTLFTPVTYLVKASNLSDLASASTARTNLGLGTAAVQAATYFLQAANNLSDVASAATSRTNLGLGTAAVQAATYFAQVANNLSDLTSAGAARTNLGLGSAAVQAATYFAQVANNLSDLTSASTARTNLGLGSAAVQAASYFLQVANNLSDVASKTIAFNNLAPSAAKGDVIIFNGTNNVSLNVGTNGYVPIADSATATGWKWGPVSSASGGDVVGPGTSTTNAIATYADPTGTLLLNNPNFLYDNTFETIVCGGGGAAITGSAVNSYVFSNASTIAGTGIACGSLSIFGGIGNSISGNQYSAILGGFTNSITGNSSTIVGGSNNTIIGNNCFIAGYHGTSAHNGCFVWADSSTATSFAVAANYQYVVRATGGVGFNTASPQATFHAATGTTIYSGNGAAAGTLANYEINPYVSGAYLYTAFKDGSGTTFTSFQAQEGLYHTAVITTTTVLTSTSMGLLNECTGSSAYTVTLPDVTGLLGQYINFSFNTTSNAIITLTGTGGQTINGQTSVKFGSNEGCSLYVGGSGWTIVWQNLQPVNCMVTMSAPQTISSNTLGVFNIVNFDTKVYDVGSFFNVVNFEYTPLYPGKYEISLYQKYDDQAVAGTQQCAVSLNSFGVQSINNATFVLNGSVQLISTTMISLNGSTDYITALTNQNSGSSMTLGDDPEQTYMYIKRVSNF